MRAILTFLFLTQCCVFGQAGRYAGSAACKTCHPAVYKRWSKTRMANVVRDPKTHPDAIIPDLSKPDPLVKFTSDDIAFVYGSKWKQRYFTKKGDDYYPLPRAMGRHAQDLAALHGRRRAPTGGCPSIPTDNMQRPTGPLCDGCHSVNYNIADQGRDRMERGLRKVPRTRSGARDASRRRANIVNPARLDFVQANNVCIQCHSQGQPLSNPIEGKYYDWPVGFEVGQES